MRPTETIYCTQNLPRQKDGYEKPENIIQIRKCFSELTSRLHWFSKLLVAIVYREGVSNLKCGVLKPG
jgi:hypothetical protein